MDASTLEEDVPKSSFSQLLDRGLALPPARAHWCPTMDLLAILTSDGQLQLYRLNWQRLWSITPESPITCLCWRPDGKQIAVGQRDGSILLLNTEDGETHEQRKIFEHPVEAITWTFSSSKTSPGQPIVSYTDRTRKFFEAPLPPAAPHTAPTSAGFENYAERLGKREEAAWHPKLDVMDVIACGSNGEIALCGEGLFLIAKHPIIDSKTIHQMSIPPSLSEIAIRWATEEGEEVLSLVDISFLAGPAQHTIRMLCSYAADIIGSIRTCRTVSWQMWKEWQSVQTAMDGIKSTLNELLKNHGVESDAQSDLLLLVTMGEYTPPMEQFLMNKLGEAGLKKVGRGVDAALCAMHALLVDRLQPEMEMLAFRLGELRGMAANPMNRKLLTLHAAEVTEAEKSALALISSLEVLRERLTQGVSQYRTFFSWLTTALRRFPEDTVDTMMGYPLSHVDAVRSFLHYEFATSLIEPFLFDKLEEEDETGEQYAPEIEPVVVFNSENYPEIDEEDEWVFWDDEKYSNSLYCSKLITSLKELFFEEKTLDKDNITEAEEVKQAHEEVKLVDTDLSILHRISKLHKIIVDVLVEPTVAMSRRLRPGQGEQLGTSHWVFVPHKKADKTSNGGDSNTAAVSGGVLPGVLQYAPDTEELLVALEAEIIKKSKKCLALMTVSAKHYSKDPIYLESLQKKRASVANAASESEAVAATERVLQGANFDREVKFVAMWHPEGHDLVDIGYYKDGALALLLEKQENKNTVGTTSGDAVLALIPREHFIDALLPASILHLNTCLPAIQAAGNNLSRSPLDLTNCRQRKLPYRHAKRPMAISATRGIAFVLNGNQRAILYDLEEDEEGDEEDEGEEGEEEEEEEKEDAGMADVVEKVEESETESSDDEPEPRRLGRRTRQIWAGR